MGRNGLEMCIKFKVSKLHLNGGIQVDYAFSLVALSTFRCKKKVDLVESQHFVRQVVQKGGAK